ncbi:proton-conducting membrane transporter [Hyphomicrobium methylovorum]|uniref:complex I subunit 5 family protein n=1 Tax=Hyphomicrobium methylovorum TaxID=84 RepID=UPI0015E7D5D3|nr:proton-conducting transporter membrane subunit [Hyphomicrobium methylovorum]MBA2125427.1 proton-conducting membrane transporter [Hyphomicrobium methylovorum]
MVTALLHPLNIFILGFGGGFLIPLLNRVSKAWAGFALVSILMAMALIVIATLISLLSGSPDVEILTGGSTPPYSINLRMGIAECIFCLGVLTIALLGTVYILHETYSVFLIYLIIVTGLQGLVMTRDLFNLFVFIEVVSIGTYGLLALGSRPAAQSASFKYIMATVLASAFLLLGIALLYAATGLLNIDFLIARRSEIVGLIAFAGLAFILGALLVELKPFPANGWGLDVYETAPAPIAAFISAAVSAGVFFALYKLLPLFDTHLHLIAFLGVVTFVFSNIVGLRQDNAQRLLGCSSIAQMGLLVAALALLYPTGGGTMPLVVVGLFVNHLLAKAGLFWIAAYVGKRSIDDFAVLMKRPLLLITFCVFFAALAGLPPFPGFWAKWHLVLTLAAAENYSWIFAILVGSLLEAAYLFRWFGRVVHLNSDTADHQTDHNPWLLLPPVAAALFLLVCGFYGAVLAGLSQHWLVVPILGGIGVYLIDALPGRTKSAIVSLIILAIGFWSVGDLSGISFLFAALLSAGAFVLSLACLYRSDRRPGFHALLTVMLLSLLMLPRSTTSLEFFFVWELITLSSYLLILRGRNAEHDAQRYLLFSLVAAFFLLAGFAIAAAVSGTTDLTALRSAGSESAASFLLFAVGFLIKAGAIGVHVWVAGAYAEAEDDLSAMLSALVSKVPVFGLLIGTYIAIRSETNLNIAYAVGVIGMLTTLLGAMLALREDDMKRMLAYSSMSQLGYIVTAIALTSHLGWVTAFYLTAHHLMVKGILFLSVAAIILRTGVRRFSDLGGLARRMPLTFALSAFAILAMSGLPPLTGFGGKWLLLSSMMGKQWYVLVVVGVLSTFVGFLYMWHFLSAVFVEKPRRNVEQIDEAPWALLVPQTLLALGIIVMAFYPKLLLEPLSQAIDPYFASTLIWYGMSLELIYGAWNPLPTMLYAVAGSAGLFGLILFIRRLRRSNDVGRSPEALSPSGNESVYDYCTSACSTLTPPCAVGFWNAVAAGTMACSDWVRRIYNGDGQLYNLYVLYYLILLFIACGGAQELWRPH